MEHEKVFFSYSRADSAFALRLAGHLKAAGVPVWIDQRDMRGGSRWDAVIEQALDAASKVIVLLSPSSVSSDNVKNEVAYALEAGKTVIPILAEKCTPFLMIIRLHRIDFTRNYGKGLEELYETLGVSPPEKAEFSAESKTGAEVKPVGTVIIENKPEKAVPQEENPAGGEPVTKSAGHTASAAQPERVFDAANKKYSLRMIGWGALTGLVCMTGYFAGFFAKVDRLMTAIRYSDSFILIISVASLGVLLLHISRKQHLGKQLVFVLLCLIVFLVSNVILQFKGVYDLSEIYLVMLILIRNVIFGVLTWVLYNWFNNLRYEINLMAKKILIFSLAASAAAILILFGIGDEILDRGLQFFHPDEFNIRIVVFLIPLFHFFFHPLFVYAVLKTKIDSRNAAARLRYKEGLVQ